jgi:hypothetical protein
MNVQQWAVRPRGRVYHAISGETEIPQSPGRIIARTLCSEVILTSDEKIVSGFHVYAYKRCATCMKVIERRSKKGMVNG